MGWGWTLIDVAVTLARVYPSSVLAAKILSTLVASDPALAASKMGITPIFLFGWIILVSGTLIRVVCFRTLGRLFTFELSIRKDHRLITTGPYSVVRHPSYTGGLMVLLGWFLCHVSGGSWMRECSGLSLNGTVGRLVTSVAVVVFGTMVVAIVTRTYTEDAILKSKFSEWDQWAKQVPWKLTPFVF